MPNDTVHMRHALRLAGRALGRTAPNPAVGCVIVSPDGRVLGRGSTGKGGRPHAESVALERAGAEARGATAYVTLEPCAHYGETPPCADALAAAGLRRIVIGCEDSGDPRVNGRGIAHLRAAGMEVVVGVLEADCRDVVAGFFLRMAQGRPLVTLKIAQSLDGRIATSSGESKWITGESARRYGHLLRACHDAVLVGIGTVLADDPELTCRLPGLEAHSPWRVVLDSQLRLNPSSKLACSARDTPTIVFTSVAPCGPLAVSGVEIVQVVRDARGRPDIEVVLRNLAARGVARLLVEGGAGVHATFLDRRYADRLEIFTAPTVLGSGGNPSVAALAAFGLDEVPRFRRMGIRRLGSDVLESYAAAA